MTSFKEHSENKKLMSLVEIKDKDEYKESAKTFLSGTILDGYEYIIGFVSDEICTYLLTTWERYTFELNARTDNGLSSMFIPSLLSDVPKNRDIKGLLFQPSVLFFNTERIEMKICKNKNGNEIILKSDCNLALPRDVTMYNQQRIEGFNYHRIHDDRMRKQAGVNRFKNYLERFTSQERGALFQYDEFNELYKRLSAHEYFFVERSTSINYNDADDIEAILCTIISSVLKIELFDKEDIEDCENYHLIPTIYEVQEMENMNNDRFSYDLFGLAMRGELIIKNIKEFIENDSHINKEHFAYIKNMLYKRFR